MMTEPSASVEDVAKDSVYRWLESLWKFKLSEVDEWVRAGGADADGGAGKDGVK